MQYGFLLCVGLVAGFAPPATRVSPIFKGIGSSRVRDHLKPPSIPAACVTPSGLSPDLSPVDNRVPPLGTELQISTEPVILLFLAAAVAAGRGVGGGDIGFSVAFPVYIFAANRARFRCNAACASKPLRNLLLSRDGDWFKWYVRAFGIAGLVLPLFTVALGPPPVARAAAPHLYLTMVQCACEAMTRSTRFAALPRLLVPIGFNAFRLGALRVWISAALALARAATCSGASMGKHSAVVGGVATTLWAKWGVALAALNVGMWSYNLFGFLLLKAAPQYLDEREFAT